MTTEISPAVEDYLALDVSPDGEVARLLLGRAGQEAESGRLELTAAGDAGALSAGLTQAMSEWLNQFVASRRGVAVAELMAQARDIRPNATVDGLLLEAEHDRIDNEKNKKTLDTLAAFNNEHSDALNEVDRLQSDCDHFRAKYENREAKHPNLLLEWTLLFLIMVPEALLNFESFRRAPIIQSDAMALGATILVGLGVAGAAYCFGLFIRRYHYYAREDDAGRRRAGWPLYSFGSILLAVSLGTVGAARYYYLLPKIQEAVVIGAPVPNVYISVGSLLFGNLIGFFLGVVVTFFMNDPDPEYADKASELRKAKEKYSGLFKLNVLRKLDSFAARAKEDREEKTRTAARMASKQGFSQLRQRVDRMKAKDMQVVGLLQNYRTTLIRAIRERNAPVEITMREPTHDAHNPVSSVPLERFSALPLRLLWSS